MLAPGRVSPNHPGSRQPAAIADRLSRFTMVAAAALTFVLAIVLLADVVNRLAIGRPLRGSNDIVGSVIVMIVFLQAGYAVRCRSMHRTDFLLGLMPWPMRRVALAVGYGLGALLFAAIAASNWQAAFTAAGGTVAAAAHAIVVFGAALTAINYTMLAVLDLMAPEPTLNSELAELRRLEP